MFGLVSKYRGVLLLLALVAGTALTFFAHSKEPDDVGPLLKPFQNGILAVEAPVEAWMNAAAFWGIDKWQSYFGLRHVREENQKLREELLRVEGAMVSEAEIVKENERMRELLQFTEPSPWKTAAAPVIGDSLAPTAVARVIRIGIGQRLGVKPGMPVVAAGGVVGRVSKAYEKTSDVQLVVDPASAVAVRDERSRARANVMGTGSDQKADLEYALRTDDIQEGDLLVTSGTDGVFPAGLQVGKVVDVHRKASATFLRAQVAPAVDVRLLEDVLVVLGEKEALETEPAAKNP